MAEPVTLDAALDVVMQLSREEQEMLLEILRRRRIEQQRQEIAAAAREARELYQAGKLKAVSAEEAIDELNDFLASSEEE